MIEISTKYYGIGELLGYDPRFPGYFSGKFTTPKGSFTINDIKKRDIKYIKETLEVKCIQTFIVDCLDMTESKRNIVVAYPGDIFQIDHIIEPYNELEYWDIHFKDHKIDEVNYLIWNDLNEPFDYFDTSNFRNFEFTY